jgi:hypothetical protein
MRIVNSAYGVDAKFDALICNERTNDKNDYSILRQVEFLPTSRPWPESLAIDAIWD